MAEQFTGADGRVFDPTGPFEYRNKFVVGAVVDGDGSLYFLKAPRDPNNLSVRNDLGNEVRWNQTVGPALNTDFMSVPEVEAHDPDFLWAVFEYVQGQNPAEAHLAQWSTLVARISRGLQAIPLGREGSDLTEWFQGHITKFDNAVLDSAYFRMRDKIAASKVISDRGLLSRLTPGIVHGDINLKNLLLVSNDPSKVYLVDAEFGTLPEKPEWDKPRFDDLAYYYHLLLCQYHRPDLAEDFVQLCLLNASQGSGMSEQDFMTEFNLSVLERTVSMMGHFIVRIQANKKIDDQRRREPEPYVETIRATLAALAA